MNDEKESGISRNILTEFGHRRDVRYTIEADLWLFGRIKAELEAHGKAMKEIGRVEEQQRYKASFLWPHEDGSIESLGYEFVNAKTEEFRMHMWDALCKAMFEKGREAEINKQLADDVTYELSEQQDKDADAYEEITRLKERVAELERSRT